MMREKKNHEVKRENLLKPQQSLLADVFTQYLKRQSGAKRFWDAQARPSIFVACCETSKGNNST